MKFTIITPSLNQARYLPEAMRSILSQEVDLQWLVIDAMSTDGTVELLKTITDPRVRWTSEKDDGQSDAINKGFARATGDIVAWLNCDDRYTRGALKMVQQAFLLNPDRNWLAGRCDIINEEGKTIRRSVTKYKNRKLSNYSYRSLLLENFISQPAVFWRRSLLEQVGQLDESLHWTMDYDLWLRMGRLQEPIVLPQTLAQFRMYKRSKSGSSNRTRFEEDFNVAMRYIGGDKSLRWRKRLAIEKIVWAYRVLGMLRR